MLKIKQHNTNGFALMAMACAIAFMMAGPVDAQEKINREVLPVVTPEPQTYTELDVRNTKPPAPFNATAPKGAPNVVIVLIDDVGFGATTTFGGPINTPTMDKLCLLYASPSPRDRS